MPAQVSFEKRGSKKGRTIETVVRSVFGEKATFIKYEGEDEDKFGAVLNGYKQVVDTILSAREWEAYKEPPSRQTRWNDAIVKLQQAVDDMTTLKEEKDEFEEDHESWEEDEDHDEAEEPIFDEDEASDRVATANDMYAEGISELEDLQSEYQEWLSNLPEQLQYDSPVGEKLQEVTNMSFDEVEFDLDDLSSGVDEAENAIGEYEGVELPLGWGRD